MPKPIGELKRRGKGSRPAFMISLILHGALCVLASVLLLMSDEVRDTLSSLDVVWIEGLDNLQPVKRRMRAKAEKRLDTEKPIALKDPDKLMEQARNEQTEVERLGERTLTRDALNNEFERADRLNQLMTAADMDLTTDVTNLSKMASLPGRTDGKGRVTGRARVQGSGLGSMLFGNEGDPNGLLGGGGDGLNDPLDIIDFLRGRGESGRIVYVLDVSASMAAAGLYKLELAKESLIDHLFLLSDQDEFNVVTFSSHVSWMRSDPVSATGDNISTANAYLAKFTQEAILDNRGTNTLGALQTAFGMEPDAVVLLTDGVPTSSGGKVVETDPDKIIAAVEAANRKDAALYIVGMEIDNIGGPGELLLKRLASHTGGKVKFVGRDELMRYKDRLASTKAPVTN